MKKILLSLSFCTCLFVSTALSQITVMTSDLPVLNAIYTQVQDSLTSLTAPSGGTGQNWNYSTLNPNTTFDVQYIATSGGLNASDFSSSTMARSGPITELLGFDLPVGGGIAIDAWAYYKYGSNGLLVDGFAFPADFGPINLGNLSMKATPSDIQFYAPSTMGNSTSITTQYKGGQANVTGITNPDTFIVIDIVRDINVIGSGNITTPSISNEPALLYEENITFSVGFSIELAGFSVLDSTLISNVQAKQYYFIGKEKGFPLLSMAADSTGTIVGAKYLDISTKIMETRSNLINVFPTPAESTLNIELDSNLTDSYRAVVIDIKGKIVLEKKLKSSNVLDINDWSAGVYLMSIYDSNDTLVGIKRVVKK